MTATYNELFNLLLTEYDLPEDFSFSVHLPAEVKEVFADQLPITELGVTSKLVN